MRRQKPSSYYNARTKDIVENIYSNWQLTRTDEREGVHTLINRTVVAVADLANESEYIQNKFFPDKIDIDEPWLIYKIQQLPRNLYQVSGDINSSVFTTMPAASSLDEFFDGYFDSCSLEKEHLVLSGETANIVSVQSSLNHYDDEFTVQTGNAYITYDLSTESVSDSGSIISTASGVLEFYTDINNRVITLDIDAPSEYQLLDENGRAIEHQIITKDNEKGFYDSKLDIDGNGVICDFEKSRFMRYYGSKMSDYTPSEWDEISWADINKNNKIDEIDLRSVNAIVPSLRDDIKTAICVTDSYIGKVTLFYKVVNENVLSIYRTKTGYSYNSDLSPYAKYGTTCSIDEELDIHYILDKETNTLRSVSRDGNLYSLLYVPGWKTTSYIVDIDFVDPFLYVLTYDNESSCRLYFSEMKGEAPTFIDNHIDFSCPAGSGKPVNFTMSKDNTFIVVYENKLVRYKLKRSTYFATTDPDVTFFRTKPVLYDTEWNLIEPQRHYIFNSFDSFAYSLGISRPYGVDNQGMRDIIYDFFKYPQGHGKAETTYGIMRELGYTNSTFNDSANIYSFPGNIVPGELYINGTQYVNSGEYPVVIPHVGTISNRNIVFTREYLLANSGKDIVVKSKFADSAGNENELSVTYSLPEYSDKDVVEIHSYRDTDFLEHMGYLVSGEPTDAFISFVNKLEANSAFTYGNCIPDVSIFGRERIPTVPRIPTVFDTMVKSSGELEVTLE